MRFKNLSDKEYDLFLSALSGLKLQYKSFSDQNNRMAEVGNTRKRSERNAALERIFNNANLNDREKEKLWEPIKALRFRKRLKRILIAFIFIATAAGSFLYQSYQGNTFIYKLDKNTLLYSYDDSSAVNWKHDFFENDGEFLLVDSSNHLVAEAGFFKWLLGNNRKYYFKCNDFIDKEIREEAKTLFSNINDSINLSSQGKLCIAKLLHDSLQGMGYHFQDNFSKDIFPVEIAYEPDTSKMNLFVILENRDGESVGFSILYDKSCDDLKYRFAYFNIYGHAASDKLKKIYRMTLQPQIGGGILKLTLSDRNEGMLDLIPTSVDTPFYNWLQKNI